MSLASQEAGVEEEVVRQAIRVQGERLRRVLGLGVAPIRLVDDTLVAEDVAGLVRLLPSLELEIAPKFLGASWEHWREDFLVIANIARSGHLLVREGIASTTGARDDLASLVARTFVNLFDRNQRRPLRTYRPQLTEEWAIDGDIEAEDLLLPGADGYQVRKLALTGNNVHNSQIARAATLLAPEVHDGVLQRQVRRISRRLGPQTPTTGRPPHRVPSRHRSWQDCYDLAREINAGFGVRFAPGKYASPGYVLTTWLAFEHLLVAAMRAGLQSAQVTYHPRFVLGTHDDGTPVAVEPDLLVRRADGAVRLLDAKYKSRVDRLPRISPSDLYEAIAFAEASGQDNVTLVYPRPADDSEVAPVGSVELFDEISVDGRHISAVLIECRGISGPGGFLAFATGFATLA